MEKRIRKFTTRMTDSQLKKVKDLAANRGVTPSDVIREAIDYFVEMETPFNDSTICPLEHESCGECPNLNNCLNE